MEGKAKLRAVKCDVKDEEQIKRVFAIIREETNGGGADVCINNAGLAHDGKLLSGSTDDWRDMLEVSKKILYTREIMFYYVRSMY